MVGAAARVRWRGWADGRSVTDAGGGGGAGEGGGEGHAHALVTAIGGRRPASHAGVSGRAASHRSPTCCRRRRTAVSRRRARNRQGGYRELPHPAGHGASVLPSPGAGHARTTRPARALSHALRHRPPAAGSPSSMAPPRCVHHAGTAPVSGSTRPGGRQHGMLLVPGPACACHTAPVLCLRAAAIPVARARSTDTRIDGAAAPVQAAVSCALPPALRRASSVLPSPLCTLHPACCTRSHTCRRPSGRRPSGRRPSGRRTRIPPPPPSRGSAACAPGKLRNVIVT